MVLHVGDVAYADGREYVWDSFMDAIEPAASRVPYMVAVGALATLLGSRVPGVSRPFCCPSDSARAPMQPKQRHSKYRGLGASEPGCGASHLSLPWHFHHEAILISEILCMISTACSK